MNNGFCLVLQVPYWQLACQIWKFLTCYICIVKKTLLYYIPKTLNDLLTVCNWKPMHIQMKKESVEVVISRLADGMCSEMFYLFNLKNVNLKEVLAAFITFCEAIINMWHLIL